MKMVFKLSEKARTRAFVKDENTNEFQYLFFNSGDFSEAEREMLSRVCSLDQLLDRQDIEIVSVEDAPQVRDGHRDMVCRWRELDAPLTSVADFIREVLRMESELKALADPTARARKGLVG